MSTIKCPKCKSTKVQVVKQNTKVALNLNPLKPFTVFNHKPKGKTEFLCTECGKLFEKKL